MTSETLLEDPRDVDDILASAEAEFRDAILLMGMARGEYRARIEAGEYGDTGDLKAMLLNLGSTSKVAFAERMRVAELRRKDQRSAGGDIAVSWVRRSRIDGDSWQSLDVPLGETSEAYEVRVVLGGQIVRAETVTAPGWIYLAADQSADGAVAPFDIEVAQVNNAWGPGTYARITWNG